MKRVLRTRKIIHRIQQQRTNRYRKSHQKTVGNTPNRISVVVSGTDSISNPIPSPPTNLRRVFWYHRYEANPTWEAEKIAVSKGMIPIINISNSSYSWGSRYETLALQFQAENGNCTIALSQAFWNQFADTDDAWDTEGVWLDYIEPRRAESSILIPMIDVEPPPGLTSMVGTKTGNTWGVAGTAEQIAAAKAFVSDNGGFYAALPDLRDGDSGVPTTDGSYYNILPGLGRRQVNEYTYSPTSNPDKVSDSDIVGVRVNLDGSNYSWLPEQFEGVWSGRDLMIFPGDLTEEAKIQLVRRLPDYS